MVRLPVWALGWALVLLAWLPARSVRADGITRWQLQMALRVPGRSLSAVGVAQREGERITVAAFSPIGLDLFSLEADGEGHSTRAAFGPLAPIERLPLARDLAVALAEPCPPPDGGEGRVRCRRRIAGRTGLLRERWEGGRLVRRCWGPVRVWFDDERSLRIKLSHGIWRWDVVRAPLDDAP